MGAWKHHGEESESELLRWGEFKTKWRLSGLELGWDLNSAFPVTPTELHSCKNRVKAGEVRGCTEQVPEMASGCCWQKQSCSLELGQTCGIWGASRRAWQSCQVGTCHTQCRCLAGSGLWKLVDGFSPHMHFRHSQIQESFCGGGLVKCITKEKAVLSRGLTSKQDRARPHYFAVSHIYLPFIPFLNCNTSSDHRVSLMWQAHPCTVVSGLVNQHGKISETFGEIFSDIFIYLRTEVLGQLFCCSVVSENWSHI